MTIRSTVEIDVIAMTGAGGKLGRAVAAEFRKTTPTQALRLGTRSPGKLANALPADEHVVGADFDDPASLERLFAGCNTVLVISGDADNARRVAQHANAFAAARRVGVERIVYTSFANAVPSSKFLVAPSHVESEAMLKALGISHTILRNNLYAENIMIEAARATGELVQPHSNGRAAYISYSDVARATAAAISGRCHENKTYEISGPEALNHFDIAERLTEAWSRPVRARDVSEAAYADSLTQRGLPRFVVELLVSLHDAIGAGEYAAISHDAAELAGAAPEPVSAFLRRA